MNGKAVLQCARIARKQLRLLGFAVGGCGPPVSRTNQTHNFQCLNGFPGYVNPLSV